jgi:tRNA (guanine-N7-)-methyltransferase
VPDESGSPGHAAKPVIGPAQEGRTRWRRPGDDNRAFFGRRKGHPLKAHQAALYDTLLPKLSLDLTKPAPNDVRALFPIPVEHVRLEIGFGGAEHLIAQAVANPNTGFIGSEPFVNGMAKALAAVEKHKLQNIRLSANDATHLLAWLPATSLSRVDILYPDPWPKRRQWKRRFLQDDSLAALARILKKDGELRFATDIAGYASWVLARILRSPSFEWMAGQADDWRNAWPDFVSTRYEAKAKREGRTPAYFRFRKT